MTKYLTTLAMREKGLMPHTKIVLYWLAHYYDTVRGEGRLGYELLCHRSGCSNLQLGDEISLLSRKNILQVKGDVVTANGVKMVYTLDGLQFHDPVGLKGGAQCL